uniref:AAA+ ATPase domain-containing protein n=1 Tax=Aegilops tauschii TaxID=37682 RepID=M8C126_AEGTA
MGSAGSRGTTKRSAAANALVQNLTNSAWMYLAPMAFGVARSLYNQHLRRRLGRHVPSVDPFITVDVVARPGDPRPYYAYHDVEAKSSDAYAEEVWSYTDFDHPATFETLAMNPAKKRMIMDDLDDFRDSRDYYRRIGKAWKRGYFLYGPPGTGKSSMVAAMANHLNYDVYDVELASLQTNSDLRKLFAETTRRSIIVIEDIDCSLDHAATEPQRDSGTVTLPGLLSFIDGLWSAHGGERIVVVTTNRTRALDDPALARRGRMDVHVEMSYCELGAFMTLAKNYLGVDAHPLFYAVEELLRVADMTPADVAECLMARSERTARRDADACLARLVDELRRKAAVGKTAVKEKLVLLPGKEKSEENQAAAKENGGEATADGTTS